MTDKPKRKHSENPYAIAPDSLNYAVWELNQSVKQLGQVLYDETIIGSCIRLLERVLEERTRNR